ncbi:MAG: alpha/beta hydrolase [Actinomycetota bacterium]|nr:alpha/beta hydrolase [Actinomycetota bacterium]
MELVDSSGGVRVALWELGGSGRPLLVAHATGFCAHVLAPLASDLASRGSLRCVAPDVRGHGSSVTPPDADLDWRRVAEDLLACVDHLGLDDVDAFGHSMGGAALLLAELARPGTFHSLWCYEPVVSPVGAPREGVDRLIGATRRRRTTFASIDDAIANFSGKPPLGGFTPEALRGYLTGGFRELADGSVELRCRPDDEARLYEAGQHHGAFERLGEIGCVVSVGYGRTTDPGPAMLAPEVVERLPRGRGVPFPHLGHFGPMEAPAEISAAVAEHLVRVGEAR